MALYAARIVSLCLPHAVDVIDLSIRTALRAFVAVISMCLLHVSLGPRVCESYVVLDQRDESSSRLCSLSVRTVVQWGVFGVPAFYVSFVSCIAMMSGWVLCTRFPSSSTLFLMPSMLT